MVIPKKLKTGFFEKKSKQLPHFCHVKEEKKKRKRHKLLVSEMKRPSLLIS